MAATAPFSLCGHSHLGATIVTSCLRHLLLFLLFLEAAIAASAPWYICSDTSKYAANSTYEANLIVLMSSLASNTHLTLFSNASFGTIPNRVEGLALCQGDLSPSYCRNCIASATSDAPQLCPYSKAVDIWYDYCQLRYSNTRIISVADSRIRFKLVGGNKVNTSSEVSRINRPVSALLDALAKYAVQNSTTPPLFAAGDIENEGGDHPRFYGLVQCTKDIAAAPCDQCLQDIIGVYKAWDEDWPGKRFLAGSCMFRSEVGPFYNWSVKLSYPPVKTTEHTPPPAPSPSAVSNNKEKKVAPVATGNSKKKTTTILLISIPLGLAIVLFLCIFYIGFLRKGSKKRKTSGSLHDDITMESLHFDWLTIKRATNNFSQSNKLGEGGYGSVYKGVLQDGEEIAIKRSHMGSLRGIEQLKNEILLLANLQHRNLVRFLGICVQGEERILVYEFVVNKSLEDILFDPIRKEQLNWERRYKIITGIARGLLYLHEESQLKIIHRDLKASNVLLDMDMNPKISDFGTARLFCGDQTHASTNTVVGTFGYMAPEYVRRGHLSEKLDVYSFGVLVLEMVTGRRNSDFINSPTANDLLSYVLEHWYSDTITDIIDPSLGGSLQEDEAIKCIKIGLLCVQELPTARPTISSIVLLLHGDSRSIHIPIQPTLRDDYNLSEPLCTKVVRSNVLSPNELSMSELDPR